MATVRAKSGGLVTIGKIGDGYPQLLTTGQPWSSPDAGIRLLDYVAEPARDPLKIWKTQPELRKVVDFAARQFASIPWHLYRRVGDNDRARMSNSPAERILANPSEHITGFMLIRDLTVDLMVYDICCAVLAGEELHRIPPNRLRVKSDGLGRVTDILIDNGTQEGLNITGAPKIMTWGWHPHSAGGVSPMYTLAEKLDETLQSVIWRKAQWERSPKMSGSITRPVNQRAWSDEQRRRFKEDFKQWQQQNMGGTLLLEDGMTYTPLTSQVRPRDMRDIEGRKLTGEEVASAFHIPPELVGAREGNYNSVDAFRQMLFGPTLGPMFQQFQQAINQGGLIESLDTTADLYLEANREAGMAGSFMEQARIMQTMVGGPVMTTAEGRSRLNLPYLDGTDELIKPLNVTQGGQASPTDSGEQNVGGDNAAPENREDQ